MKVIILSAGRGSRIKKFTNLKPKCFIKINNKSILDRLLKNFEINNLNNISIITGYKSHLFKKFGFKKILNKEWKITNMVYSLFLAKKILLKNSCIICYSDIIFDNRIIKKIQDHKDRNLIPYNSNWKIDWKRRYKNPYSDLEKFIFNSKNEVLEIGGAAKSSKQVMGQYMGIFKLSQNVSIKLYNFYKTLSKKDRMKISMTDFLQKFTNETNFRFKTLKINYEWHEIDTFKDFKVAKKYLKN